MLLKNLLLLTTITSLLISCKKDDDIKFPYTGTWKFEGATATHSNTYVNSEGPSATYDSIVYVYSGTISPLNGSVIMTSSAWDFTEAQYNYEQKVETITYKNGSIAFSNVQTSPGTTLTTSRHMEFKVIHADSIYFRAGVIEEDDWYLLPLPMLNTGASISVSGNTMYVRMIIADYNKNTPYPYTRSGSLEKTLKYVR
jgi:hypothetical protein